jgi:hypothetical protein
VIVRTRVHTGTCAEFRAAGRWPVTEGDYPVPAPPRKFPTSRIVARPISPRRRYSLEGEPQDHTVTQSTDSPASITAKRVTRLFPEASIDCHIHTYPVYRHAAVTLRPPGAPMPAPSSAKPFVDLACRRIVAIQQRHHRHPSPDDHETQCFRQGCPAV